MNAITKLILVNLIIVAISLLLFYPIYIYFLKNNPGNYTGILLIFAFILVRPRAKIVKYQSGDKVQIKWFRMKWDV